MNTNPVIATLGRRLRLAVIGGGPGSFIGGMHRMAARLDDCYQLVAGVLSSDPDTAQRPSGVIPTHRTQSSCPRRDRTGFPVERSHTIKVLSLDPEIANLPSGVSPTQVTSFVCPGR